MNCEKCGCLLYDSTSPKVEGQFDLVNAIYCPKCGSPHLQFVWMTYDVNRHSGEGNYDVSMGDFNMMMFGDSGRPVRCLDCKAEFGTSQARWSDNVEWDPNDYSD